MKILPVIANAKPYFIELLKGTLGVTKDFVREDDGVVGGALSKDNGATVCGAYGDEILEGPLARQSRSCFVRSERPYC